MFSMIHVQVQHYFYQNFPPPRRWQPMLSSTTFLRSKTFLLSKFYHHPPPGHAFKYNIPLSKTFLLSKISPPPLGSPCFQWFRLPGVICDPTWPKSRGQPMLSSTTFLLSKTLLLSIIYPPALAAHAFKYNIPFFKNIPFIKSFPPPLGSPCFQWFRLPGVICDLTWPQCKEPSRFLHYFKVWGFYGLRFLANPCFQWFRFKYNILFIKNIPFIKISPPPSWQPMLSMIQVTRGHLRPYLTSVPWAAHAFKYRNSQQPLNTTPNTRQTLLFPIKFRTEVGSHNTPHSQTKHPNQQTHHGDAQLRKRDLSQHPPKSRYGLLRTLPNYFVNQQFRNNIGSKQHTIHPNIALRNANAPRRRAVKEQPEISPHPPKTSHGLLRPYPTSLSIHNAEQR